VQRLGADEDIGKAWELMRRQQASADAIGLGEVGDHYHVGQDTRDQQGDAAPAQRGHARAGHHRRHLRRLLQVRAVRYVQKELGHYFNNNLVLFLSGMRNYDMAVALSDYTKNLKLRRRAGADRRTGDADLAGAAGALRQGQRLVLSGRARRDAGGRPGSGFKSKRIVAEVAKSHVIVGTFHELKAVGNASNLAGKTLITSAVDDERLAFFAKCKVNLVVDVSPKLFDQVVGINTIEAMILAALGKPPESVSRTTTSRRSSTSSTSSRACCTPPGISATSAASPS
jgi:hypothetical protein